MLARQVPVGMHVEGVLKFTPNLRGWRWPERLTAEVVDLTGCTQVETLPCSLDAYELNASETLLEEIPNDIRIEAILNLTNCRALKTLPPALRVGSLILNGCSSLRALPEDLDVWGLSLIGCWSFEHWPSRAWIRSGQLNLRGCAALRTLPAYLGPLAALNVRDCPNLTSLPDGLVITGWIDVAQSGLARLREIPPSLRNVEVRWQGVIIDERIWLRPETIEIDEILSEQNAERRRVLIDRFGQSRFMAEAKAQVLDEDQDAGGPRQLLQVELQDDEPLVTLSCACPSTGRRYFLRVPPTITTCHQAAAWIAGYDDPNDYQPLIET